ncbi:hypothetical protein [Nonomuraea sp. NPDC050202]|jgi:hypothetical protein|uniref:hypothetical protein n=1 Tax=Nonomuraea sp. NPDC050202 TaxID=3155035 RepID=UPI0033D4312C
MNEQETRRYRSQTGALRRDTVIELRQALRSMRDGAAALTDRLERYDRLDEHDMDALGELVAAAVAGRPEGRSARHPRLG